VSGFPGAAGPVGIFDSGVGGLSVLQEIRGRLPNERLLYVADCGFAPYGERSVGYVQQRSRAISEFLLAQGAKAIVVACNTATAAVVPVLRQRIVAPIVAIEPAVKPAAARSRSGVIGVLATRRTLESERFARLVSAHAAGVEVVTEACPELVALVERGITSGPEARAQVEPRVRALLARRADAIVLGCTHFHFLRSTVEAIAGEGVSVIDPGIPVAVELARRLKAAGLARDGTPGADVRLWTSGDLGDMARLVTALLGERYAITALPAEFCVPPSESESL